MTPFFGFSQKLGAVWKLPLSETSTLCATSRAVMPTCATRVRSMSMLQGGQIEHLLHVHVGRARDVPHAIGDLLGDGVIAGHILAHHLHVDRRGQAEVQDLRNDVGRLEEELDAREAARQLRAQLLDVTRGRVMMLGVERNQDLRVAGADDARIAVGQVDAPNRACRCCRGWSAVSSLGISSRNTCST